MEDLLEEIKIGLETGALTKEEAEALLEEVHLTFAIEAESIDMETNGRILTAISVISKLL
jgi:hypothetical protein